MRLAHLWGCSPSEVTKRIPSKDWPLFLAFYELEPFGFWADQENAGTVASTVARFAGGRAKEPTAIKTTDFMRTPVTLDDLNQDE